MQKTLKMNVKDTNTFLICIITSYLYFHRRILDGNIYEGKETTNTTMGFHLILSDFQFSGVLPLSYIRLFLSQLHVLAPSEG
jgi:hypothetical protein